MVGRGALGGALVGAGFVAGVAVGNVLSGLVDATAFVLLLSIGTAAGGVVGVAFALVDAGLYRLSALLVPHETAFRDG